MNPVYYNVKPEPISKADLENEAKDERQIRKHVKRTDRAYSNQLKIDQAIFAGLLPELYKELAKGNTGEV